MSLAVRIVGVAVTAIHPVSIWKDTTMPQDCFRPAATSISLLHNKAGNYRLLPGGVAHCAGIVPDEGFEVVRVQLQTWLPLNQGYPFIEAYLKSVGRPVQAVCGTEMRVPAPLTRKDWSDFNTPYREQLRRWGLMYGDLSGVCRSNVALADHAPETASLCAFSYTASTASTEGGFCLTGSADMALDGTIIADGDTSPAAMQQRALYTIDVIGTKLIELGLSWKDANQIVIFHVHEIPDLFGEKLLGGLGESLRQGVVVYRARPPIAGTEVELEVRGARRELIVASA
jgi:hypothetical protein